MSSQAEIRQLQKILIYFQEDRHNQVAQLMYHWEVHEHDFAHRVPSDECNADSSPVLQKPKRKKYYNNCRIGNIKTRKKRFKRQLDQQQKKVGRDSAAQ